MLSHSLGSVSHRPGGAGPPVLSRWRRKAHVAAAAGGKQAGGAQEAGPSPGWPLSFMKATSGVETQAVSSVLITALVQHYQFCMLASAKSTLSSISLSTGVGSNGSRTSTPDTASEPVSDSSQTSQTSKTSRSSTGSQTGAASHSPGHQRNRAVVVGGGWAGFAAALALAKAGAEVTVLDASENPGGLSSAFTTPGGQLVEPGIKGFWYQVCHE